MDKWHLIINALKNWRSLFFGRRVVKLRRHVVEVQITPDELERLWMEKMDIVAREGMRGLLPKDLNITIVDARTGRVIHSDEPR